VSNGRTLKIDLLKQAAQGRWLEIIPAIDGRFTEAANKFPKHVPCPIGTGGKDGFRFDKNSQEKGHAFTNSGEKLGDGFKVLEWAGWGFREILETLDDYLGNPEAPRQTKPETPTSPAPQATNDKPKNNGIPQKIWKESGEILTEPVKKYIENRGLKEALPLPKSLRFNDALEYREDKKVTGKYPALVGEITKNGEIVGVQRHFLTPEGQKADVANKKMMLSIFKSASSGGAVHLGEPTDTLAISEGIENSLAVQLATKIPTWAGTIGTLLSKIDVPESVKTVFIFGDKDNNNAGEKYATQLAEKLKSEGKTVYVLYPLIPIPEGEKGIDWLDVLNLEGKEPFIKGIEETEEYQPKEAGKDLAGTVNPTATQIEQTDTDRKKANLLLDLALISDELCKKYAYLSGDDEFINVESRNSLKGTALSNLYAHRTAGKIPIHQLFLKSDLCRKADRRIYWPGRRERFFDYNGEHVMNTWNPTRAKISPTATKEDVAPWLEHAEYIVQKPEELTFLLDWMSYMLQNQNDKINNAILLGGMPRIGKDTLFQPLIHGIGVNNVSQPESSELQEHYTDYLLDTKLVIFQEVMNFEKASIENKLKPMLAAPPEELRIRAFGKGFYTQPNVVQAIFMSNHRNALKISEGDGRYFAIWSDATRLSEAYYTGFYNWLNKDGMGLVTRWLINRDVSHFNPKAPAPHTAYKTEIQDLGKTSLEMEIEEKIDGFITPFDKDIIRLTDVGDSLQGNIKQIGSALTNLGYKKKECKKSTGKREKITLWVIRDLEGYEEKGTQEIIRIYEFN